MDYEGVEPDVQRPSRIAMRCKSCFHSLDGIASNRCPECGELFDREDSETFLRSLENPVLLVRISVGEAAAACALLEQHGILAMTSVEMGGVIGYAPSQQVSIWVDRADRDRAQMLCDAATVDPPPPASGWRCTRCDEIIEGQFGICWNCGGERAST